MNNPQEMNVPDDPGRQAAESADESRSATDALLDAFLREVISEQSPPDLKASILRQLRSPERASSVATPTLELSGSRDEPAFYKALWAAGATIVTLAACLTLAFMLTRESDQPIAEIDSGKQSTSKSDPATDAVATSNEVGVQDVDTSSGHPSIAANANDANAEKGNASAVSVGNPPQRDRSRGVVLVPETEVGEQTDSDRPGSLKRTLEPARPITLVAKRLDTGLEAYWRSIGVEPTGEATAERISMHLSERLGIKLDPSVLLSHGTAQDWLARPDVAKSLSINWWNAVSDRGFARLEEADQAKLISKVAKCFETGSDFGSLLCKLLSGSEAESEVFFQTFNSGRGNRVDGGLVQNLAALTMNVDLRCVRCHDAFIEGNHQQQDYWNFAAVLSSIVDIDRGQLRIRDADSDSTNPTRPLFFELPDRRQRVATAKIASHWIDADEESVFRSESKNDPPGKQWVESLNGSSTLARGIVNSIWKLVHGRPLRGLVAHPMSAPLSDGLESIETELVQDLVRSGFDIRRTMAVVMMSPTVRRSVPVQVRDVWATDQSDAHQKAVAFAGSIPTSPGTGLGKRIDQTMLAIGAKLSRDGLPTLGQFDSSSAKSGIPAAPSSSALSWDFPDRADELPVQWLSGVNGTKAKIEHLAYLAERDSVPGNILSAADAMKDAGLDEPLLMHRVWWLMQSL